MNGYLQYNPTTSTHGKFVQSVITAIKGGKNSLGDLLLTFQQMIIATGGDGSQDADYAVIQSAVGAPNAATARGIFDELNSLNGKITTDASVDHVSTAIEQAAAKLKI